MKPKIEVDFNELIDDNQVLLSQTDVRKDIYGNDVLLTEGLEIDIFDIDYDDKGNRDDLVASGVAILCKVVRMPAVNKTFTQNPLAEELENHLHRNFPGTILQAGGRNSSEILFNFASPALDRKYKPSDKDIKISKK